MVMDDDDRKLKMFELSSEYVEVCRDILALHKGLEDKLDNIHKKYMQDSQKVTDNHHHECMSLWAQIAKSYNLDPVNSFSSGEWYIEQSFLEFGHAFLCERSVSKDEKLMRMATQGSA